MNGFLKELFIYNYSVVYWTGPLADGNDAAPQRIFTQILKFCHIVIFLRVGCQFSFPKECDAPGTIVPEVGFILVCPPYDIFINER